MRKASPLFFIAGIVLIAMIGVSLMPAYTFIVRAEAFRLYATTCLGGWENTHLAAGAPDANAESEEPIFTSENSALLNPNTHAQIYCGEFRGDILENTAPQRILVRFSWSAQYPTLTPLPTAEITPEATPELTPAPTPEITPEPPPIENTPLPAETPTSFLQWFGRIAHAETPAPEATLEAIPALTETENTTPATEITGTPAPAPQTAEYGIVQVLYTLDGIEWSSLGFVAKNEFSSAVFEIPIEEASDWEGISKIQIGIQSMPVIDSVTPAIYLDSLWLEVEYALNDIGTQSASVIGDAVPAIELNSPNSGAEDVFNYPETDVPAEDLLARAAPLPDPTLAPTQPPLRQRKENIIADPGAAHRCMAKPFNVNVSGQNFVTATVIIERASDKPYEAEIGDLPAGIDVVFAVNNDYFYALDPKDHSLALNIHNHPGSQKGSFTIPLIFTERSGEDSSVICQINIVNLPAI